MKRFRICNLSYELYVSECVPETNTFSLTTDTSKANSYVIDDASLIKGYVENSTGLTFEMIPI